MARGLNSVNLVGTLTQAPEMRYTANGLAILELNVAGNDHVVGSDGQERELAWYHRVSLFGNQAEMMADQLNAGDPVFIDARLNFRTWETPEGQRRSMLSLNANRVERVTYGTRSDQPTVQDARGQDRLRFALNEARIIGNLTRDAELRYTPSGDAVLGLSVAVNERYRDRNGQDQESTHFVDVDLWRELAEASADLQKGAPVFVTGRLKNDSWTDREGNQRRTTKIEASRIEFLTRGSESGGSGTPAGGGGRSQPAASPNPPAPAPSESRLDIDEEFPPEEDLPF